MATKELTYNGYLYLLNRIGYWLIKNNKQVLKKDITLNKKTKTYSQIVENIKKNGSSIKSNEYIGRLVENHIAKKGELPSSVKSKDNKRKYSKSSYSDMVKRVITFRKKEGRNPKTIKATYENIVSESSELKPYLTNQGCSGMGQCTAYNCACNSLQQCFYRLTGILVPESVIAGWAGTTTSGTDHDGINTAVEKFNKKYDKNIKIKWYNFNELGNSSKNRWNKIKELNSKSALFFHLLYRDMYGHYEGIKTVDDILKILNSLGDRCNYPAYCGYIENRSRSVQERYISGISQKSVAYLYRG